MVPLKTWLLLLLFSLYVVSIYISHELAQSLLSNNMANLTKSSELVAEVKRRLANNVYPGQSSPYINTTLKQ